MTFSIFVFAQHLSSLVEWSVTSNLTVLAIRMHGVAKAGCVIHRVAISTWKLLQNGPVTFKQGQVLVVSKNRAMVRFFMAFATMSARSNGK